MFNKGVASKISMLFCTLVVSGCIVIKGTKNKWEESTYDAKTINDTDISLRRWEKNKYEIDNGSRISIGIIPGAAELWANGFINEKTGSKIDSWPQYIFCVLLGNCFVLPTIDSLIEPVTDGHFSSTGIIGCHRWSGSSSRTLSERGPSEYQAEWKFNAKSFNTNCAIGKSGDGTPLYLDFPGGQKLLDEVNKNDKVDCLMPNGDLYRFSKSQYSGQALSYEVITDDIVANRQIEHQKNAREIKKLLDALKSIKGYAFIDSKLKADIDKLNLDIKTELKLTLPSTDNVLEDINARRNSIVKRIENNFKMLCKKRRTEIEQMLKDEKYEEVIRVCKEEIGQGTSLLDNDAWNEYTKKATAEIDKRNQAIELARIEKKKVEIQKLLDEKRYDEVITECNKEKEDLDILAFKNLAQSEKDKIDRAIEEKRIALKLEQINQLLSKKKFSEVIALCDEERGQNAGSRAEDLQQWKSIRLKAKTEDVLAKAKERSKTSLCIKGFYLGMSIDEVEILLDYYFPSVRHSREGFSIAIAGQTMHFCEMSLSKVTRFNFSRKMLDALFDYNVQSDREWISKFAKEYGLDFRTGHINDSKSKGDASISVSQSCYSYRNSRKNVLLTYFGEKDVTDYNKDPEQIEGEAMAKVLSYGNDMLYRDLAYQIGHRAGYAAQCVKQVRAWLKNEYENGKGAEEGTLRVELLRK